MAVLGFIGMGNMGYAMLKGVKNILEKKDIIFHSNTKEKMEHIRAVEQIEYANSNSQVVSDAKYIVLAVKPQMFEKIISEINDNFTSEHIVISLAPGFTIEQLRSMIPSARVVRAMPNTPAMVGAGMTGICYDKKEFNAKEEEMLQKIFTSFGKMQIVDEKLMNSVVCASGSSPAYVFLFIEALADSVVKCGMTRAEAYEFVAQTVLGSAKLMMETGFHPGVLKDMVCSPGGTTIAGVEQLEKNGFRKAVFSATEACFEKCNQIK